MHLSLLVKLPMVQSIPPPPNVRKVLGKGQAATFLVYKPPAQSIAVGWLFKPFSFHWKGKIRLVCPFLSLNSALVSSKACRVQSIALSSTVEPFRDFWDGK